MSDPRHYLSGEHVLKSAWDTENEALRMIPSSNTSFSIELDAADGDNVMTIPKGMMVAEADEAQACVGMKTVCLYGTGTVSISPSDSEDDFQTITLTELVPSNICARRIKITGSGKLVLQAV